MSRLLLRRTSLALLVTIGAAGCATKPLAIRRPANLQTNRLADLHLPAGTDCLVGLTGGGTLRGGFEGVTPAHLTILLRDAADERALRHIDHADVVFVARAVGKSKVARGWIGAAIAAAVSVPLGVSMVGDMVMPAAIVGALIGRSTGDSRGEIVYEVNEGARESFQSRAGTVPPPR
jgi:hypothetical protein